MTYTYQALAETDRVILRVETGEQIPLGSGSIDEQDYLHWASLGNTLLPAPAPDPAIAIRQKIQEIEEASQVSGPMRAFMLGDFQAQFQQAAAQMTAAGTPTTAEQLLSHNIMYQKALAIDNQIKALEAQLPS